MSSRPAVDDIALRLACVRLAIDSMGGLGLLAEAALIERYVRWGKVPIRPRTLSLTLGAERPRTKESPMAGTVHSANELPYDLSAHDAITGAEVGLADITFTVAVAPPEAGELTQPDADGKGVFRPAAGATAATTCAVSFVADFGDGSEPVTLADSVTVDPDGRVVGIEWGPEQPRTGG